MLIMMVRSRPEQALAAENKELWATNKKSEAHLISELPIQHTVVRE